MREILVPRRRQGLVLYTTGAWSLGPPRQAYLKPPFRGKGWTIGFRTYQFKGRPYRSHGEKAFIALRGFSPTVGKIIRKSNGRPVSWKTTPELVIFAKSQRTAQQAANLLFVARLILRMSWTFVDHFVALAENDLSQPEFDYYRHSALHEERLPEAAALAARLSSRRKWQYAAMKFWASFRLCGPDFADFHPRSAVHRGVTSDPFGHVACALAITSAYGVLEELGLELRASKEQPAKVKGVWNPVVRSGLERRLQNVGVNLEKKVTWVLRGPRTRIEAERAAPQGSRAPWTFGPLRDRQVEVVDAIAHASWLRSRVSAHRTSSLTMSLTEADVHNVQMLARYLLLLSAGSWPPP
jgi:hypothetical protein